MTREIKLISGNIILIDDDDYPMVSKYRWYESTGGYAIRGSSTKNGQQSRTIYLHRFLLNPPDGLEVDHINRNRLDNQRHNLRIVTRKQNAHWREGSPTSRSRFKGVGFFKSRNVWRAYIKTDGKFINIGYFASEQDAARAYDAFARRLFGDYAYLNFPEVPR